LKKGDRSLVVFEKAIAVLLFVVRKGDRGLVAGEKAIAVLLFSSKKRRSRFCYL